jgi:hypothetical protein
MGKRSIEKERHWREVMARYKRSGMKVRAFCDQEQIKESQFFAWKRELKRRDVAQMANEDDRQRSGRHHPAGATADLHGMSTQAATMTGPAAAFAPLHVVTPPAATSSSIEIIVGDGRRVAVAPGFDPEVLSQVLAVVEGRGC